MGAESSTKRKRSMTATSDACCILVAAFSAQCVARCRVNSPGIKQNVGKAPKREPQGVLEDVHHRIQTAMFMLYRMEASWISCIFL